MGVHIKTLWSILSASNSPSSLDLVGPFVEKAKNEIVNGLLIFKPRPANSTTSNTFVGILSKAINLEEGLTDKLLETYKSHEFRGTDDQFDHHLKSQHLHSCLISELWQFYQKERIYLLHCVEFILRAKPDHPYQEIYQGFLKTYDSKSELKVSLIKQLKFLSQENPPVQSGVVTLALIKLWWASNLREKLMVLQCLLCYSEIKTLTVEDFIEIISTFEETSKCPLNSDTEMDSLHYSTLHLQSVLLTKILNVKASDTAVNFAGFNAKKDGIEDELERISSRAEYSPVLLSWMLINYVNAAESTSLPKRCQQLGEKAIGHRVIKVISDVANDSVIQGESFLKDIVCTTLNNVVFVLISCFDTERLSSTGDMQAAATSLLRCKKVCADFWLQPDQGVNLIWKETMAQFPVEIIPLLELAKAVAQTSNQNKIQVMKELDNIPFFIESMDSVPEAMIKCALNNETTLLQTHYPYRSVGFKDLLIPRGVVGSIEGKFIRWHVNTSLYDVAAAEILMLLHQASLGLSAIKNETLTRVQKLLDFLELVIKEVGISFPEYGLRFRQLLISLLERFGPLSSSTSELLASCFSCLAATVTASNVTEIALKVLSTSVLPCTERPLNSPDCDFETLMSIPILPGVIGSTLAGIECPQGLYPLTAGFLKLMAAFTKAELSEPKVMVPCTMFILKEIAPFLIMWQYMNLEQRDLMVNLCFTWIHCVLEPNLDSKCLYLQQICIKTLLETRHGEAESLLMIAAYGGPLAEMQLLKQTNWDDKEGRGLVLLRQIRLGLSILNLMLNMKHRAGLTRVSTPLESLLSAQRANPNVPHFIAVLADYIFYKFDLCLPILALKVMRSCATRWNVSLLACLGNDSVMMRNTWLTSLEWPLEDVGLLEAILRLLTDAVAKQPGLMHMLVNGEDRCLNAVAQLLHSESQRLRLAATQLLHSFWFHRCSPAVEYFKKRQGFWKGIGQTLLVADKASTARCVALVFHIIAIELYNTQGNLNIDLKQVVDELIDSKPGHLTQWSDLVLNILPSEISSAADLSVTGISYEDTGDVKLLLSGWADFLVMLAYNGPKTQEATRWKISNDVLDTLINRAATGKHPRLLSKLSELHWMLLQGWKLDETSQPDHAQVVEGLGRLLTVVSEQDFISYPIRFQATLITSAISTLRSMKNVSPETLQLLDQWARPVTICTQACLIQLPRLLQADQMNQSAVCVTALCLSLLRQLLVLMKDHRIKESSAGHALTAIQETFLLQSIVSTIQLTIHHRNGWEVAEAAFTVLHAVAQSAAGSAVLTSLQLEQSLWLPLELIYHVQPSIYRLGLQLCTMIVQQQRHFFLNEALTLVGVHQRLMTFTLLKLQNLTRKEDVVMAVDVMALLYQLSKFQQTWRLQHWNSMQGVLQAAAAAVYFSIAHLIRPTWLANITKNTLLGTFSKIVPEGGNSISEANDVAAASSPAIVELQNHLLELISQGVALLNCYSPPLAALLTEDGIDVSNWERHLSPSFGTPSLDHFDGPPSLSFGTLNAVATYCLRILSKSNDATLQLDRSRLSLVLEQSLSLLLSQALLYILDPRLAPQEKQMMKRELGAELGSFVESIRRHAQRGLRSPAGTNRQVSVSNDQSFLKLVGHIVQRIFK